ncbi:patatin-like protein [Roseibium suaedae]|uniref:Patatin-related protein n=1 Tax=Roseibium suaedae TaxID=735517 RepID=A0A1M7FVL2_9HYPH|nr:patatin-like protein [Roseibium suaedae]SHM07679.1 patatin-related protein [Roseibium suaedae]
MKEIELRLALVFYGGVSLAIYMHGVSREVLNLVRASACRSERIGRNGVAPVMERTPSPTQLAYEALLDRIGKSLDIRVVVDAIAGASAGGVNGIMLARAIAHDLPLDAHTSLWLKNADVTELARPQNGLKGYLKSGISPMLDRMITRQLKTDIEDAETREKLRTLMQSRWFTPPFSGERFSGWMLDACAEMDRHHKSGATLIPRSQTLDLFVTLTDYRGQVRRIHIDDPAYVEEWDHRRLLRFHAKHRVPYFLQSDFGPDCVPELVFAARATSSFPGAFPPATVLEMDEVLASRKDPWPHRQDFISRSLELKEEDLSHRCFVDGSVVMNKPFSPVIETIRNRPAAREVARRLIYVDPVPAAVKDPEAALPPLPGFFRTILASLAHIPRNEPVGDDLRDIEERNRRGRWLAQTIAAAAPVVDKAVRKIVPGRGKIQPEALTRYRAKANSAAHRQAGYAFLNYEALKLQAVSLRLSGLMVALARKQGQDARQDGLLSCLAEYMSRLTESLEDGPPEVGDEVVLFLRGLDVDFRIRRLRFAIRKLNSFYQQVAGKGYEERDPGKVDEFKSLLYEQIDNLVHRWDAGFYGKSTVDLASQLADVELAGPGEKSSVILEGLVAQLKSLMGLPDLDRLQDELFAVKGAELLPEELWRDLLRSYVGFAFYDLVTLPLLQSNDFSEVSEILIDRISPKDACRLSGEGFRLKGAALNSFGAFFNRGWREHDYLWGRLNAADRLISVVLSAAGPGKPDALEEEALRDQIFKAILEEEDPKLTADPALIPSLRAMLLVDNLVAAREG